jgi:hypothetical protein
MPYPTNSVNLTYYELLNICPADDLTEGYIKQKFRTMALKLHPDKAADNNTTNNNNMALLVEARDTLIDPQKRAIYNQTIFGDAKFVERVEYTLQYAQNAIHELELEGCQSAFNLLKKYSLQRGLHCCYLAIDEYGYQSDEIKYFRVLLGGLQATFRPSYYRRCPEIYKLIETHLIEPIENQLNALKSSSDTLCQIKASQLEYILGEINETVFQAHFRAMTVFGESGELRAYYCEIRAARAIYEDLHQLIRSSINKNEINSHRNLIVDILKALLGAFVIFLTALPTAGALLISRSYRNAIHTTFFTTKSRSCLENADHSLYKFAKRKQFI